MCFHPALAHDSSREVIRWHKTHRNSLEYSIRSLTARNHWDLHAKQSGQRIGRWSWRCRNRQFTTTNTVLQGISVCFMCQRLTSRELSWAKAGWKHNAWWECVWWCQLSTGRSMDNELSIFSTWRSVQETGSVWGYQVFSALWDVFSCFGSIYALLSELKDMGKI